MSSCKKIQPMLVLFSEGILPEEEAQWVREHLAGCPQCAAEAAGILRVRDWLTDPELFAPREDLTWQLLPGKLAAGAPCLPAAAGRRFSWRLRKWALGAAALLVLALGFVWMMSFRTAAPPIAAVVRDPEGNEAFLNRMRTVYAREATSQYLSACRALLLDVMKADRTCAGDRYNVALEVSRARELLIRKQQLDADLRIPEVAPARDLCDQLEHLLVNLSMSSECESDDTLRDFERYIDKEQLIQRISQMQSGIS